MSGSTIPSVSLCLPLYLCLSVRVSSCLSVRLSLFLAVFLRRLLFLSLSLSLSQLPTTTSFSRSVCTLPNTQQRRATGGCSDCQDEYAPRMRGDGRATCPRASSALGNSSLCETRLSPSRMRYLERDGDAVRLVKTAIGRDVEDRPRFA